MTRNKGGRPEAAGTDEEVGQAIRGMSVRQFAQLGMAQIAYVRPVMMDGATAYAIRGADGSTMAVAADAALAEAAIEQQELLQVLVH